MPLGISACLVPSGRSAVSPGLPATICRREPEIDCWHRPPPYCRPVVRSAAHGVFAPHNRLRAQIVAGRQSAVQGGVGQGAQASRFALGWARRLKRVFGIDLEKYEQCGGEVKIIASIEDPAVIEKILSHLGLSSERPPPASARVPPPPRTAVAVAICSPLGNAAR